MSAAADNWTVLRLINWTKDYFTRSGIDEPRLASEVLLGHVLNCPRVALYTQFDRVVADEHLSAFRGLIRQAADGEPIAYLIGKKDFYSLTMKVTPDVLIPRVETELLVDAVLDYARERTEAVRLWDVCTGSGCVAVAAVKHCPNLTVLATDISEAALTVARENVERHGLGERVRIEQADLLTRSTGVSPVNEQNMAETAMVRSTGVSPVNEQNMAETAMPRSTGESFDIITSNPPYVTDAEMEQLPEPVKREPDAALRAGPTGLEFIDPLVRNAPSHLKPNGLLAIEIGYKQAKRVYDLLNEAGRYEDIQFSKDAAGIERIAVAHTNAD